MSSTRLGQLKFLLTSFAALFVISLGLSQENLNLNVAAASIEQKGFSIELGPAAVAFQDIRFSTLQYFGPGGSLGIGARRSTDSVQRWIGIRTGGGIGFAAQGQATLVRAGFDIGYSLEKYVTSAYGGNILVGGDLRVLFEAQISGASGNNSSNIFSNISLSPRASYIRELRNGRLIGSVAVSLLNYVEDATSFAFSFPQDYLEEGNFTYQPEGVSPVTPFTYNDFQLIGKYNEVRTLLRYEKGKHWGFQYDWMLRGYRVVKGYPTRAATHRLAVSITF